MHLVFSTKYREHLIHPPEEDELHAYLGGICKRMECHPLKIGGYTDHVHILCMLSKKIALMKLLEEVKSHSSKWLCMRLRKLSACSFSKSLSSWNRFLSLRLRARASVSDARAC